MTPTEPTIPHEYNIIARRVVCFNCGHVALESTFMAVSFIRARHHTGTPVRHSMKCDGAQYNLPIKRVNAPQISIPFCAVCPSDISLSHLPPPPSEGQLTDLPEPVLKTTRAKPPGQPPRRKPTIEELA